MNENQIQAALSQAFEADGHRIVFWNDPEASFSNEVEEVLPESVSLIRLPGVPMLAVKMRVELEEPEQKFLVYDTREEPPMAEDWLLDIREYSYRFTADRSSVMLGELGLERMSLKAHLQMRDKFLANKQRVAKLKTLVEKEDLEEQLDLKMMAVVVKADTPDLFGVLRELFAGLVDPDAGGLDQTPAAWADIGKLGLEDAFWQQVVKTFGFESESPTLKTLLLRIMVTDLVHQSGDVIPDLTNLVLPAEHGRRHARVFLAQWSDSQKQGAAYDAVAREAEVVLKIEAALGSLGLDQLRDVHTFPCTERAVLRSLVSQIREQWQTPHTEDWLELTRRRVEGHWVRADASTGTEWRALHVAYRAVRAAVELVDSWQRCQEEPWPDDLEGLWSRYVESWWQIDQAYRHFTEAAEAIERHGWDILKGLRNTVEDIYVNGYLAELSLRWGERAAPRLSAWQINDVKPQHRFFTEYVQPRLDQGAKQKAMVIISDAFRFEAARELVAELNSKYRFEAQLDSLSGVLPSYTTLGMAALLPHKAIAYAPDGKTVRVDGQPAASTDQRSSVLAGHGGLAIQAEELLSLTKSEGRSRLEGARLVYVYHNRIDAVGDSSSTEEQTFDATSQAIEEVAQLVNKAVNELNFNYVVATADHGFLFTHSSPNSTNKSAISGAPSGSLITKKRYILGTGFNDVDEAWRGNTATTAGTDPGLDFLIPKGTNLFHFVGGARFIHGGAMPQEVVVPAVVVRQLRGTKSEATRTTQVKLQILGGPHRITTGRHRFKIIQLDPVSDRVQALAVRVDLRDGDTPVSDTVPITFDSQSSSLDERTRQVLLTLKNFEFDRHKVYSLIVRDAETGVTVTRADVHVDRAFTDDF